MAFRETDLSVMVRRQPREAVAKILSAYKAAGYNLVDTAAALGVTARTLSRWVVTLGIEERVKKARREHRAAT